MTTVENIFGFTGSVWEIPDIDTLTISELLEGYNDIYFTLRTDDIDYLGTKDTIESTLSIETARARLIIGAPGSLLTEPLTLVKGEWRLITSGEESNNTVLFPDNELIVINGGQFLVTEDNGTERYVVALADNMVRYNDPMVGSCDLFYDCGIHDINVENLTEYYDTGILLIGGMFIPIRDMYTYLGTGVNLVGNISGWLPTLYKKVAELISPYECGLNWPLQLEALQEAELYNKLIGHGTSHIISFDSPAPVTYESNTISRLFPSPITGFLCYDGRPSPNRVTKMASGYKCPTKFDLYPEYIDINDNGSVIVSIDYNVKDITPKEHTIKFITYEVSS